MQRSKSFNDQSIAPHATAEFERYTRCEILEHGFVRLYCKDCQAERVIGFSCKGRGFCPTCGSRRALQKADRIEREVWPRVQARKLVLTFPHQVRSWLLRSPELFNEVISVVVDSISFFYEQHSALVLGKDQIYLPTAGSVSFVQFFGSSLAPNPHLHMMMDIKVIFLLIYDKIRLAWEDLWKQSGNLKPIRTTT